MSDFSTLRRPLNFLAFAIMAAAVAACATVPPNCRLPAADGNIAYVVSQSWHVDIGLPADRLEGPLAIYREIFPGAKVVMFGYGKRTFMTAPPDTISEYLIGPLPGPAVIFITGLKVLPADAYSGAGTIELALPPDGARKISDFIWDDLSKDTAGKPRLVAKGDVGLFYAANSGYNLLHTCNTWAVDALAAAGLPVSSSGVVFSGQAMGRAGNAAAGQCAAATAPAAAAR
jgi:hypothetical protein